MPAGPPVPYGEYGVVMPSLVDHTLADPSGRDPAPRPRPRLRASPRLEVLETRCLMSGWHPRIEHVDALPLPIRHPAVTTKPLVFRDRDRHGIHQPMTREGNNAGS